MKVTVSVCIPTYNGVKYLKECLDSVLAQTFTDFEILIVDDRSSDNTVNIAQEYATRDPRIRVIVNERNLGLVGNWNRCIELAQGEWIKFVFQDDLIAPTCLEKMLAASKPDCPIIACHRNFVFEDNATEETRKEYQKFLTYLSIDEIFPGVKEISAVDYCQAMLDHLGANFIGEPTSVMLHKSVFRQFGIFNSYLLNICDFEFWTRVAIHTGLIYVPETLATFRIHNTATSAKNKNSRRYRAWLLDILIMLHDFAFAPDYAPLRDASQERDSLILLPYWKGNNLVSLLANNAYDLKRMAERAANNSKAPNLSLLEEWNNLVRLYPILSTLAKRSFLQRVIIHSRYRWEQLKKRIIK
jgi:glycosyltransferase involved in cell wall biosynthesis